MRNQFLRAAALLAAVAAGPAFAADLAVKAPVYKAPPPAPTWTGFYIGANGGYGTGSWDGTMSFATGACCAVGPLDTSSHSIDANGGLFGGQVGYNWQFGQLVTGVEGDWDRSNIRGDGSMIPFAQNFPASGEPIWNFAIRENWMATFRGRLGYDMGGTLLYATGGLAVASFKEGHSLTDPGNGACGAVPAGTVCAPGSIDQTKVGWTVGAGIEQSLGRNWSVKAEYLFTKFSDVGGTIPFDNPAFGATDGFKGDMNINVFKGGVNYRF